MHRWRRKTWKPLPSVDSGPGLWGPRAVSGSGFRLSVDPYRRRSDGGASLSCSMSRPDIESCPAARWSFAGPCLRGRHALGVDPHDPELPSARRLPRRLLCDGASSTACLPSNLRACPVVPADS